MSPGVGSEYHRSHRQKDKRYHDLGYENPTHVSTDLISDKRSEETSIPTGVLVEDLVSYDHLHRTSSTSSEEVFPRPRSLLPRRDLGRV